MFQLDRLVAFLLLVLIQLGPMSLAASAQDQPSPPANGNDQLLKPEELDALVSPIALYPDALLSVMLMSSSYPLEIVQADRWAKQNKKLKGDALKAAVDKE